MQIATQSLAGPDHPLAVMLGSAMLIVFAGVLLRALSRLSRDLRRRMLRSNGPKTVDLSATPGPPRRANESDSAPDASPTTRPRRPDGNSTTTATGAHADAGDRQVPIGERARGRANDRRSSAGAVPAPSGQDLIAVPEPGGDAPACPARLSRSLGRSSEAGSCARPKNGSRASSGRCQPGSGSSSATCHWARGAHPFSSPAPPACSSCAPPTADSPRATCTRSGTSAQTVRGRLPDYDGPVHAALVLAFEPMTPRTWYGGTAEEGRGGWALGITELRPWLSAFGPACGLRNGDVRRLDEAARPRPGNAGPHRGCRQHRSSADRAAVQRPRRWHRLLMPPAEVGIRTCKADKPRPAVSRGSLVGLSGRGGDPRSPSTTQRSLAGGSAAALACNTAASGR